MYSFGPYSQVPELVTALTFIILLQISTILVANTYLRKYLPLYYKPMKPKGSRLSYNEQRAEELYAAYKKALPRCLRQDGTIDGNAAVVAAIASPCSRYWVSEGVAYSNIIRIKKDYSVIDAMYPQKRLMYIFLYAEFNKLREDPSNSDLSDTQVAYLASASPAPSFFMSVSSAKNIIEKERRRRQNSKKL